MNNSKEERVKLIKVTGILIAELILALFIFDTYPVISMIFLGEGANSPLYSNGNAVLWALMPILVPTLINLGNINYAAKNKNSKKLQNFKFIQLILMALYIPFMLWRLFTTGFHI